MKSDVSDGVCGGFGFLDDKLKTTLIQRPISGQTKPYEGNSVDRNCGNPVGG